MKRPTRLVDSARVEALSHALRPKITWVRWAIAPALVFMAASLDRGYQTDFWHHLALGRAIVDRHQLVDSDLFLFTIAGQPLRDANWLTQVMYYRLFAWGGISLVQFCNAGLLVLALAVLVRTCKRESGSLRAAAAAGVLAFLGLWHLLLIRPQTLSFLLFVLLYATLSALPRRKMLLAVPPFIMALWANVHGGFPIGLLLVGAFALAEILKAVAGQKVGIPAASPVTYMAALLLAAIGSLANPYGWKIYQYVGVVAARAAGRHIEEWLPPTLASALGQIFFVSIIALVLFSVIAGRMPSIRQSVLILCFLPLACHSTRMIAWWLLVVAPMFASLFAAAYGVVKDPESRPSLAAGAFFGALMLCCAICVPWAQKFNPLFGTVRSAHRQEEDLAVVSADLGEHGRVFARLEWGEYLDWSLGPHQRIFMDGRIEAFPDSLWQDYCSVTSAAPTWGQKLDDFGVDYLLLDAAYHRNLSYAVRQSNRWIETARCGQAVLFARRQPIGGRITVAKGDF